MAKARIAATLNNMYAALDAEYARKQLDKNNQIVTITKNNIKEAFIDGYFKGVGQKRKNLPVLDDSVFQEAADVAFVALKKYLDNPRSLGTLKSHRGTRIVFTQPRAVKAPFNKIKNAGISVINKSLSEKRKKRISLGSEEATLFKQRTQRLHGEITVGTGQLALAFQYLEKTQNFAGFAASKEARKLKDKFNIELYFITTGRGRNLGLKIKEGINIGIDVKSSSENPAGSEDADWTNIRPALENAISSWAQKQDWYNQKGSKSMAEDHAQMIEHETMQILSKGLSVKKSKTSRPKRKDKNETVSKPGGSKRAAESKKKGTRGRRAAPKKSPTSIHFLIGVLNERLPRVVAKNMTSPALEYQTGRFASSVRVTDISKTSRGFPSIGYTYQRDPYETFELGNRMGTQERDPRRLIDRSIREIAAGMAIGRFYTRRV
jgi:hypothetical protein